MQSKVGVFAFTIRYKILVPATVLTRAPLFSRNQCPILGIMNFGETFKGVKAVNHDPILHAEIARGIEFLRERVSVGHAEFQN